MWSVSGQPSGITMNPSTGVLSGTPTVSGSFSLYITVRDSGNPQQSYSKALPLTVAAAASALSITTTTLNPSTATVGTTYTAQALTAAGGTTPYTWSVSGQPSGVTINPSTGVLSGTPTAYGTFNLTVTVRDSGNPQQAPSKVLPLTVADALTFTNLTPTPVTAPVVNYQPTLTAAGTNFLKVTQLYWTWSGTLPGSKTWLPGDTDWTDKVVVNSDTSMTLKPVVSLSTDVPGTYSWSVTMTDTSGASKTWNFTVTFQ
jgi:hypothetical protein